MDLAELILGFILRTLAICKPAQITSFSIPTAQTVQPSYLKAPPPGKKHMIKKILDKRTIYNPYMQCGCNYMNTGKNNCKCQQWLTLLEGLYCLYFSIFSTFWWGETCITHTDQFSFLFYFYFWYRGVLTNKKGPYS